MFRTRWELSMAALGGPARALETLTEIKTAADISSESVRSESASLDSRGERRSKMEPQARKRQIMIWYSIIAPTGVLLVQYLLSSHTQVETVPYSTFERLLADNQIAEVTVGAESIQGVLKEPLPAATAPRTSQKGFRPMMSSSRALRPADF